MQTPSNSATIARDQSLLKRLQAGEEAPLLELYRSLKPEFIHWAYTHYNISNEAAEEIFQLSMITLYENAINHKLQELNSSLKTYLFAIGKNKTLEYLRKGQKVTFMEDLSVYHELPQDNSDEEMAQYKETSIRRVAKALEALNEGCRKIISLFYYQKQSMRDIMAAMGYNSEAVARNQRYRCVEKLKALLQ